MNIERYTMPVIIAAALHGALLLSYTDTLPPRPNVVEAPPVLPPMPQMEMSNVPEVNTGEAGAGRAEPLPQLPDIPDRPESPPRFTVPVTPAAPSIKPVVNLPDNPRGPIGTGEIENGMGLPTLPSVHHLDRRPRAMVQPSPAFPEAMRISGTNGSVTVAFVVDTAGRVVSAEAVRCSQREFAEPAVRAVLRWRFEPGTINGRKVSFRMAVPIEFNAAP